MPARRGRYERVGYNDLTTPHKQKALYKIAGFLLATSAHIAQKHGVPCVIADMTAGPGVYDNGEIGSPLIFAQHIRELTQRGYSLRLICTEEHPDRLAQLDRSLSERYPDVAKITTFARDQLAAKNSIPPSSYGLAYFDPTGYFGLDHTLLCAFGVTHPHMDILITRQVAAIPRVMGWEKTAANTLMPEEYLTLAGKKCQYSWQYARHDKWTFYFGDNWPKRPRDKVVQLVPMGSQVRQGELPWAM